MTAALDGLVFTPTINEVAPGQVVTTTFGVSVTDGLMTSAAASTTANITALNDPPVISGLPASLVEGYWNVPLNPFPAAAVTDPDVGATETVTLTVSGRRHVVAVDAGRDADATTASAPTRCPPAPRRR